MSATNVKAELISIADHLPDSASYADAMYELYVRMKVDAGKTAVAEGRVHEHGAVRAKYSR